MYAVAMLTSLVSSSGPGHAARFRRYSPVPMPPSDWRTLASRPNLLTGIGGTTPCPAAREYRYFGRNNSLGIMIPVHLQGALQVRPDAGGAWYTGTLHFWDPDRVPSLARIRSVDGGGPGQFLQAHISRSSLHVTQTDQWAVVRVRRPGCYAMQVDRVHDVEVVLFRLGLPTGHRSHSRFANDTIVAGARRDARLGLGCTRDGAAMQTWRFFDSLNHHDVAAVLRLLVTDHRVIPARVNWSDASAASGTTGVEYISNTNVLRSHLLSIFRRGVRYQVAEITAGDRGLDASEPQSGRYGSAISLQFWLSSPGGSGYVRQAVGSKIAASCDRSTGAWAFTMVLFGAPNFKA